MSEIDFLKAYTEYASSVTDAPVEFHDFVGLGILSTALGNRVCFEYGDFTIYPNVWIILLAPSSAFRKTTALRIGKRLLGQVCSDTLLPNEFSQEKLLEILDKQPQGVLVYYEFMSLTGLLQKDYMAGTKAFLTEIYDCPRRYIRKTKGAEVDIDNPVINILAATTTEWFLERAKVGDMYGGFLPRFMYVPVTIKVKTISFPKAADANKRNTLVRILGEIRRGVRGTMEFSEAALQYYDKWYKGFEARTIGANSMSAFQSRLTVYCLKIACLYEMSTTRNLIVGVESMERACKTINWLSKQLQSLAEEFTFTRFATDKKKLLRIIKEDSGISRSKLLRQVGLESKYMGQILATLKQEERIEERNEKEEGKQRKSTCYYEITS